MFHELGPAGFAQPYFPFFKYETLPIKSSDHCEKASDRILKASHHIIKASGHSVKGLFVCFLDLFSLCSTNSALRASRGHTFFFKILNASNKSF
jgi:hypothetical protein